MLLYSIFYLVYLGVTCKKSARNLKFEKDFRISKKIEIEISHHLDKQSRITRLILKKQDSNFTCKPNSYSRKKSYFGIKVERPLLID